MVHRPRRLALSALVLTLATVAHGARSQTVEGMAGPSGERLRYDAKGLSLAFPEPDVTLRIGGRLQLDFGAASLSRPGLPDPFSDHVAVRRAWIEPSLTIGRDWFVSFQYDFNQDRLPIADAYVAWTGLPDTILTLGNMKEPFSLEWLQNNNDTLFTERSLANGLVPDRRFGIALGRNGEAWTAVAGVYGGAASDGLGGDGVAAAGRATVAPILRDDETLHLGVAGILRSRDRNDSEFSLSTRAEAFLFGRPFVDTGTIPDVSRVSRIGAEAAYRNGPFLVQAEFIRVAIERFGGAPRLGFQGGYVEGSVVLNGAGRAYALTPKGSTAYAVFKGVAVPEEKRVSRGGVGVFEVAARLSAIDLDDRAARGGLERDATVGLNWYPEPNLRLTADYVRGRVRPAAAVAETFGPRAFSVDTLIARVQLYW